jgi:hypothetical protein
MEAGVGTGSDAFVTGASPVIFGYGARVSGSNVRTSNPHYDVPPIDVAFRHKQPITDHDTDFFRVNLQHSFVFLYFNT